MPPLQLNDEEMSVLMSLSAPIEQQRRPLFLQEVAQELEAKRQAGEVGEGLVHRLARIIGTRLPAQRLARAPRQRRLRA